MLRATVNFPFWSEPLKLDRGSRDLGCMLSVSSLETHRTEISQCRVESSFVVDLIEEVRQVSHDVVEGLVVVEMNLFALQRLDEALRLRVVVGGVSDLLCK